MVSEQPGEIRRRPLSAAGWLLLCWKHHIIISWTPLLHQSQEQSRCSCTTTRGEEERHSSMTFDLKPKACSSKRALTQTGGLGVGVQGGLNWRVLYFVWTMEVLNRSFCFFFFFLPPFSSEKEQRWNEFENKRQKPQLRVGVGRDERDADLAQRVPAAAYHPQCPAAAVPSQRPGWRSSGSWERGHGRNRRSLRRCQPRVERAACLQDGKVTWGDKNKKGKTWPDRKSSIIINSNQQTA